MLTAGAVRPSGADVKHYTTARQRRCASRLHERRQRSGHAVRGPAGGLEPWRAAAGADPRQAAGSPPVGPGNPLLARALYLVRYIEQMGTGTLDIGLVERDEQRRVGVLRPSGPRGILVTNFPAASNSGSRRPGPMQRSIIATGAPSVAADDVERAADPTDCRTDRTFSGSDARRARLVPTRRYLKSCSLAIPSAKSLPKVDVLFNAHDSGLARGNSLPRHSDGSSSSRGSSTTKSLRSLPPWRYSNNSSFRLSITDCTHAANGDKFVELAPRPASVASSTSRKKSAVSIFNARINAIRFSANVARSRGKLSSGHRSSSSTTTSETSLYRRYGLSTIATTSSTIAAPIAVSACSSIAFTWNAMRLRPHLRSPPLYTRSWVAMVQACCKNVFS